MSYKKPAVQAGDRIRLVSMTDDPDPIPRGAHGRVLSVQQVWNSEYHIEVKWDSGRSLALVWPQDRVVVVKH